MQSQSKRTNRTIVVDFQDEATYHSLCHNGRAFIEFVVAFIMSIGFQLRHKCDCPGGFRLTRHSHYMRVRLNGLVIWRIQCTHSFLKLLLATACFMLPGGFSLSSNPFPRPRAKPSAMSCIRYFSSVKKPKPITCVPLARNCDVSARKSPGQLVLPMEKPYAPGFARRNPVGIRCFGILRCLPPPRFWIKHTMLWTESSL